MRLARLFALTVSVASTTLSGCSPFDKDYQAKEVVARQLKDPMTAEFAEVVRHNGATCGYVNGKNGFGAYSGRQAFVVEADEAVLDDSTMGFRTLVRKRCDHDFYFAFEMEKIRQAGRDTEAGIEDLRRAGILK